MFDLTPGWQTTINPIYYITGRLLSILALAMLIWFITIKLLRTRKENYERQINIANLILCLLSTLLLTSHLIQIAVAIYAGYASEQFSFFSRAIGPYWIMYIGLNWLPLLLTLLFWRKKK